MFSKRLLSMVQGAKLPVAADVFFQWLALLVNVALFFVMGLFLEALCASTLETKQVVWFAVFVVLAVVLRLVFQTAASRMGYKAASAAKTTIRQAVYDKLVALGPSASEHISHAKATQISVEGVEQLESYFGSYVPQLFYSVLAPVTLFVCLFPLCWPAAFVLLICVPFIPLSIVAVQKIAKRVMGSYWGSYTDLGASFLESIQGLTTLKIFKADEARHKQMNNEAERFREATMRLLRMQLHSVTVMDLFAFGGAALGIVVTLFQYAIGSVGFSGAFTVIFLSAEFFLPLRTLGSLFHTAMNGMTAADTMFDLLDASLPKTGTQAVDSTRVSIACKHVSYSYDDERTVLEGINFDAPTGSFVGITGESGSGKSTLAGIISGTHTNYTGTVEIGGIDARQVSQSSLRECLTTVSYSSYLFAGTVRSNLLLARPEASDEELIAVLKRCRLYDFVHSQGGLDMPVLAQGSNLSGGQRQRLSVARALLHDTPVYIFDEATSNIDAQSEAAIIELIQELAKTKTIIMISHRLSALKNADTIYVLKQGTVVEQGTHEQLAQGTGVYACLWAEQAELEKLIETPPASSLNIEEEVIPLAETHDEPTAATRSSLSIMLNLVKLTKPLLPVMVFACLLGILGFVAAIFLTVFATYGLLDLAGVGSGIGYVTACVACVACGVLRGPLRYGEQICNHYLAFKILALIRSKVFAVMRRLAPAKLEGHGKGNLVALVTSDVELLEVFYAHTLSPIVIAVVVSVGMVVFIGMHSLILAGVAACAYIVVGVVLPQVIARKNTTQALDLRNALGNMNTFVLDSLQGLFETLQFGQGSKRSAELSERMAALHAIEQPIKNRAALAASSTNLIVMIFDAVMFIVAAVLVMAGMLSFSSACLCVVALLSSAGPVIALANLGSTLPQTLAAGCRILDLLEEEPQVEEVTTGVALDVFTNAELRDVDFTYNTQPILNKVNVEIAPNDIVRISGSSGSGKSTLLKLLMRFWDVTSGVIKISDEDVRGITTNSLRSIEGFMTQDTFILSDTVRANLLIARPEATEEELRVALKKASLLDFVEQLPDGLDTHLGSLGSVLSGGERQRLGLARVFLHNAPLVLLDEPTSNLDALNEAAILRALQENTAGKTIVLVSHRPQVAAIATKTYSVERGAC